MSDNNLVARRDRNKLSLTEGSNYRFAIFFARAVKELLTDQGRIKIFLEKKNKSNIKPKSYLDGGDLFNRVIATTTRNPIEY